ncbi:MAG: hypothetical protein R2764_05945 [Bacteroidales bacterium]
MSHITIIEIVISLALIYFILSNAIIGVVETLNKQLKTRGKFLVKSLNKVLNDPLNKNWADLVYTHPLIDGLKKDFKSPPSYIPSNLFSAAFVDVITKEGKVVEVDSTNPGNVVISEHFKHNDLFGNFCEGLKTLNPSDFKTMISTIISDDQNSEELKISIANWYDSYMDRASGWFKWKMKKWAFYIAIPVTLFFNIDSIAIIDTLWHSDETRLKMVYDAAYVEWIDQNEKTAAWNGDTIEMQNDSITKPDFKELVKTLDTIPNFLSYYKLPFGWPAKTELGKGEISTFSYITTLMGRITFIQFLGWLITILALSLGAPFWFETMNTFINIRNAGKKPQTEQEKNKKA